MFEAVCIVFGWVGSLGVWVDVRCSCVSREVLGDGYFFMSCF